MIVENYFYLYGSTADQVLIWSIFVIAIFLTIIVVLMLYTKSRTEDYEKKLAENTQYYINILTNDTFNDASKKMNELTIIQRDGLIAAYSFLVRNKKVDINRLTTLISESDVVSFYVAKSRNRRSYERLHAYLQLNRIGLPGLREFFFESAEKETKEKNDNKLAAVCLLSVSELSANKGDISQLVSFIKQSEKLAGGFQEGLIIKAGQRVCQLHGIHVLSNEFENLLNTMKIDDPILPAVIAAIGKLKIKQLYQIIIKLYDVADKENSSIIKISCLRAISGLRIFTDKILIVLKNGLDDTNWRVRTTACITIGLLKEKAFIEILNKHLSDPAYYVRLNAARALLQLDAVKLLQDASKGYTGIDKSNIDPYKTSICRYVLSEAHNND